jgi:hypothetical protein
MRPLLLVLAAMILGGFAGDTSQLAGPQRIMLVGGFSRGFSSGFGPVLPSMVGYGGSYGPSGAFSARFH